MKTLKYAWRFLIRSKSYTVINLLGLAFSLACCIMLMRYIHRELTVDTHCIDREHVYGVIQDMDGNRGMATIENTNKDSIYIDHRYIEKRTSLILMEQDFVSDEASRYTVRTLVADSCYFQLFPYRIVQGTPIKSPESALLTEVCARRIFGHDNPIGKVLHYSNGKDITVSGIIAEPTCKTMIQFDIVVSNTLSSFWERMPIEFVRFTPGTSIKKMNELGKQARWVNPNWKNIDARQYTFSFIPIADIYWEPAYVQDAGCPAMLTYGKRSHIYILSCVCLLLLLTGIINFINLYLIGTQRRGKEYGLKKMFGIKGTTLFLQILTENGLLVGCALLLAWLLIEITIIPVSRLLEYPFTYTSFDFWLSAGIWVISPILTSIYPFVKYNYASPVSSIRDATQSKRTVHTRILFLFIQYIFTFLLISLSLYFNKQLSLLLHTQPGFRIENVLIAKLGYESESAMPREKWQEAREAMWQRRHELWEALAQCPFIEHFEMEKRHILSEGFKVTYYNNREEKVEMKFWYATPNFFKLYGIKIIEGSIPSFEGEGNRGEVLVANRAAMKALHYDNLSEALVQEENERRLNPNAPLHPIVAVAEDYYDRHLSAGHRPIIYNVCKQRSDDMCQIAYTPGRLKDVLDYLRDTELRIYGCTDFEYTLLEDEWHKLYQKDRQIAVIYSCFALIAVLISCLGLFGISLFDIRQRYREIGIRKINGAGMCDLYQLLFRKYILVLAVEFILKISNYEEAYQALFGETPDCITPEEQQILNHSPYVVSEMFNKVKTPEEGGVARDFFENRLDKSLLNHPDANILNIIINNRFIYPYYEQKVDMIKRMSEKYTVQQNSYTHKHLLYHLTNHTQGSLPPEEIQLIINEEIMKSLDAPKDILKQMLIQRYYAGRAQDNVPQPFPIYTSEGWKIKESTILEYVYCLLDVGVYDGGIIFCCMKALLRQNDKENAQRLQEQAISKKVFINYDSYCMLKKVGAVIPKPYLFVEHYPIMKDICYQMRERGMTFEEAESRIKEMEDDLHISIARTQIYWNNVISRMANNRTNKKLVLQNTLKFIDEHHVPMSPEIYYSLLHTITSIEDYTKVKGLYKGELNIGHIFVLLKKIPEFAKYRIAEWAFVACLRQEFDEWYDILCSISEKEQEKRIKIMLQSERYKQLQVITPKGYLNQTFLFWWTIRYAVSETEEQRKAELDTLVTMIPKPFVPQYPKMIEKFFIPYPQDLLEIIREYIGRIISSEPQ